MNSWACSREAPSCDINRGQKAARGWEVRSGIFSFNLQVIIMSLGLTSGQQSTQAHSSGLFHQHEDKCDYLDSVGLETQPWESEMSSFKK